MTVEAISCIFRVDYILSLVVTFIKFVAKTLTKIQMTIPKAIIING